MNHTDKPERACGPSYVDLRDYFSLWLERLEIFINRRFDDLDSKTTLAVNNSDKAVIKAETATEKRFEGVNEFRQTLADQAATLMPRSEALSKFENMQKDITTLDKGLQEIREKGSSITGRDLQRDQTRQDVATREGWMMPMIVIGGIAFINMILNLYLLLKK